MKLLPYDSKDIRSCSICRYHKFISKGKLEGLYFLLASLFLLYGLMRSCCAVLLVWLDLSVQKKNKSWRGVRDDERLFWLWRKSSAPPQPTTRRPRPWLLTPDAIKLTVTPEPSIISEDRSLQCTLCAVKWQSWHKNEHHLMMTHFYETNRT